jgi:glutathione S-transferase
MKVHGHPLSTCTRKVLMTLAEKGVRPEFHLVDLFAGDHKKDAHLAIHPFGVIPVLEDEDFRVYESRAILRYLETRFPTPALTPTSIRDVARMDQWLSVDQSYVAPHTRALAIERILKKHRGIDPDPVAERDAEAALTVAFRTIDRALAASPYLAGDALSLADISLVPYVASLPMLGAAHLLDDARHLSGWFERVSARAAWRSVLSTS